MKKKKWLPLLLLAFFFIPQTFIFANEDVWNHFDHMTDKVLFLTKQKKYAEAKQMLERFSDQFIKMYPRDELTMKDLRVISVSTDEALKALTATALEDGERIRKVIQLRFALDALHSHHQPMWMGMEKEVLTTFQAMKDAALQKDVENFKIQFNHFAKQFDTIYPSLVIDLEPEQISRLDSHFRFLEKYDNFDQQQKEIHLTAMEKDMMKLFGKTISDETDPSLIWMIITIGTIIVAVLFYVGFKKFRAEQTVMMSGRIR
ncbi:sporulation protein YpjB [Calidifontibacillus erzurumensis]|uniref:Sporulation protein YpjB n=1 Tax=Calidifontibacillus erzurumensis TaxID=2741433 RepID=A0A8J8GIB9_9BACI|nr:sporulation protein YpjB [Calidifontibacillus erzurumensis]NSL52276.1 sporulation protein YpjB [Calidifontibacillus erzurumensis]